MRLQIFFIDLPMPEELLTHPVFILILGLAMVAGLLVKTGLERIGIPALVGYLAIGMLIRMSDDRWSLLNDSGEWSFELLGELGVICILFRVGLENDPRKLLAQLPRAVVIWCGDVVVSSLFGFLVAYHIVGLDLIPSLFVATALSATSVGVSVLIWDGNGRLKSDDGDRLIDVAELDDVSAILMMVALFAIAPSLREGGDSSTLMQTILQAGGASLVKALVFGVICYGFARFLEKRVTGFFQRFERPPDPMIGMIGIAFVIAALAGWLGFSVAVGALFAGLAFSRDPSAVKLESSFMPIYEWLTPFFFISIGLRLTFFDLGAAVGMGLILLSAAVLGKLLGAGIPAYFQDGRESAWLIGVSMIPRAEIALVVIQTGNTLGEWAVPDRLYGAMVFVTAVTCLGTPFVLNGLFQKYPADAAGKTEA